MSKSETTARLEEFNKKISEDEALKARVEAIGDDMDAAVALAAEFGFTFTVDDLEALKPSSDLPQGELSEDQLDNVAGGATQNRYNSSRCWGAKKVIYECVGFLKAVHCDHYVCVPTGKTRFQSNYHHKIYVHKCNMGCFDYEAFVDGHI